MQVKCIAALAAAVVAGGYCAGAMAAEPSGHLIMTPGQMKWSDIPSLPPGAKVTLIEGRLDQAEPFTLRVKMPANYRIPAHWHSAIEHITVLSGTFHLGMGDKFDASSMQSLPVGSVAIMPPKMTHFAMTKEATEVQLHGVGPWSINYVNPAEDPRKK